MVNHWELGNLEILLASLIDPLSLITILEAEGGLSLDSRQGHLIKVTKVSNFGIISLKLVFRIDIFHE